MWKQSDSLSSFTYEVENIFVVFLTHLIVTFILQIKRKLHEVETWLHTQVIRALGLNFDLT